MFMRPWVVWDISLLPSRSSGVPMTFLEQCARFAAVPASVGFGTRFAIMRRGSTSLSQERPLESGEFGKVECEFPDFPPQLSFRCFCILGQLSHQEPGFEYVEKEHNTFILRNPPRFVPCAPLIPLSIWMVTIVRHGGSVGDSSKGERMAHCCDEVQ